MRFAAGIRNSAFSKRRPPANVAALSAASTSALVAVTFVPLFCKSTLSVSRVPHAAVTVVGTFVVGFNWNTNRNAFPWIPGTFSDAVILNRPPPRGTTGLYHVAILYPTRAALADALRRVLAAGIPIDGASDHGVSEAIYLRDPDENGIELYHDRPQEEWPRTPDGAFTMFTRPLDVAALLAEAE